MENIILATLQKEHASKCEAYDAWHKETAAKIEEQVKPLFKKVRYATTYIELFTNVEDSFGLATVYVDEQYQTYSEGEVPTYRVRLSYSSENKEPHELEQNLKKLNWLNTNLLEGQILRDTLVTGIKEYYGHVRPIGKLNDAIEKLKTEEHVAKKKEIARGVQLAEGQVYNANGSRMSIQRISKDKVSYYSYMSHKVKRATVEEFKLMVVDNKTYAVDLEKELV